MHVHESHTSYGAGSTHAVNSFTLLDRDGATIGERISRNIKLLGGIKANVCRLPPHRAAIPKFPLLTIIIRRFVFQESQIHGARPGKGFVPLVRGYSLFSLLAVCTMLCSAGAWLQPVQFACCLHHVYRRALYLST
jgi:hypothetical protein